MANKELTPPNLNPGAVLCGRYRIENQIAVGGMATIYRAVDERRERPVAVKVLFKRYADNDVVRARFLDEGRIQAMLDHPNVIHVYDVVTEPVLSFVMEYVDGETLEQYLQREGPLDQDEIIDLMLPVLSAIGSAHSQGVVHRDLKPSNILLEQGDEFPEPKVMDFGVAKIHQGQDLTQDGTTVGTLHYMSPEQIVGSSDIDGRADIYSLGCSLYKLCTGEVPFNASSEFALMMAQVEASPTPPSEVNDGVSPELEELILRALAKERDQRFQTIKEMTSALMKLRADDDTADDTVTRPIPAELLRHAMEADEVVLDKTDQVRLAPTTDDTVDIADDDIAAASQTLEMRSSAIRKLEKDRLRAARRKTGPTRSMPRVDDADTVKSPRPELQDNPADHHQPAPSSDDADESRGIVAVDNPNVDSKEITDLHRRSNLSADPTEETPRPEHIPENNPADASAETARHRPSQLRDRSTSHTDLDATSRQRPSSLDGAEDEGPPQRDRRATPLQRPSVMNRPDENASDVDGHDDDGHAKDQRVDSQPQPTADVSTVSPPEPSTSDDQRRRWVLIAVGAVVVLSILVLVWVVLG